MERIEKVDFSVRGRIESASAGGIEKRMKMSGSDQNGMEPNESKHKGKA